MTLQSMTGFARTHGQFEETSWVWELRSVNGKGLDLRLRIPNGFEALEVKSRKLLATYFTRGNVQISLSVAQSSAASLPYINQDAVSALLDAAAELQKRVGGDLPTAAELMSMRGVVELNDKPMGDDEQAKLHSAILKSLEEAADALLKMRQSEGSAIAKVLEQQVEKIAQLHAQIEANEARSPEAIKQQLQMQVDKLVENNAEFDEQRLYQEVAILAAKADLQEELDRLVVHVKAAQDLLRSDGPVGRRLDFLAQEFNRECNTICSKSNSAEVTSIGLDMKLIIDQFREQLQNME
jgi:uncharacterized protein (TIGR00255 family)